MTKLRKASLKRKKKPIDKMPMVALVLSAGGALLGYLISEFALYSRPHPSHWMAAAAIGLLGYSIGMVIYLKYGDIFS